MKTLTTTTEIEIYFKNGILLETATKREMVATVRNHNFSQSFLVGMFFENKNFKEIAVRLAQIFDYIIEEDRDEINSLKNK